MGLLVIAAAAPLRAQTPATGIYSCTDAQGRRYTSDRPIPACLDREQKIYNPSGTVRGVVGPSLTGPERAAVEAKRRQAAQEEARLQEERRRERALLIRYPSQAVHEQERAQALGQIEVVRQAALNRVQELRRQRKELDNELEFYAQDPSRVPPSLKRLVEENEQSMNVQLRFIADQDAEKQRVNVRFDEELKQLKQLWSHAGAPPG